MVDKDLILAKAGAIKRHCKRVSVKSNVDFDSFKADLDRQEIVMFNLQMAIQTCIDIAAHIVSEEGYGVPGSNNEMFYMLEENELLEPALTEKMDKSVGLRNIIVHEYAKIDLHQIYQVARNDINDLEDFVKCLLGKIL